MAERKHVLLDLDNTLISAETTNEFPFNAPGMREKAIQFEFHDMDGYFIVFERPGVQEFLDYLFEHFTVSVWTAASKDYALFVIQNVLLTKPERKLSYVLFSYHCKLSKKKYRNAPKKLQMLWEHFQLPEFHDGNCVIIDDLDDVYITQPQHCIPVPAFEILEPESETDDALERIIRPKLEAFRTTGRVD